MGDVPRFILVRASRTLLGWIQGSVLWVFGLALFLAMLGLAGMDASPKPAAPRYYQVAEEHASLRVTMREHSNIGVYSLILQDPSDRKMLTVGYNRLINGFYYQDFVNEMAPHVWTGEDGSITVSVTGPTAISVMVFRRDGSSDMKLTHRDSPGTVLGRVRVSSEGRASIEPTVD